MPTPLGRDVKVGEWIALEPETTVPTVEAIVCADLHFDDKVPAARAETPEEWMEVQKDYIFQLRALQDEHKVPILCAGDVLNRWDCSPYLINFLIEHMPHIYSIRGQHDTPNHAADQITRSGYWTLVQAGKITNVEESVFLGGNLFVRAFPWGKSFESSLIPSGANVSTLKVALLHQYVWYGEAAHARAKDEDNVSEWENLLKTHNTVVIGDNHKLWERLIETRNGTVTVFNCGSFMRRHADEIHHRPRVGLLMANGRVVSHHLDVTKDRFRPREEPVPEGVDYQEFVKDMRNIAQAAIDFEKELKDFLHEQNLSERVRAMVHKHLKG